MVGQKGMIKRMSARSRKGEGFVSQESCWKQHKRLVLVLGVAERKRMPEQNMEESFEMPEGTVILG